VALAGEQDRVLNRVQKGFRPFMFLTPDADGSRTLLVAF